MTAEQSGAVGLDLEFLQEAALVMSLDGTVRSANLAARRLFGQDILRENFFDKVAAPKDVALFLSRASRSTSSHLGSVGVPRENGDTRFRALAARVRHKDISETLVILRLIEVSTDRFSILNNKLAEMDRILLRRTRENALLKEALDENRVLLRELQHRVKNNIQQMLSLIRMSGANHDGADVAEFVSTASHRLHAMSAAQEALYRSAKTGGLSAPDFLEQVVQGAAAGFGNAAQIELTIADGKMTAEEAHCLALITNELVTNTFKHGMSGPSKSVAVSFTSSLEGYTLEVRDGGKGFGEGAVSRSSGLSLVRGLCRQIGAALSLVDDGGAKASVSFRSRLEHSAR